jgi:limonene-1,2-epoxide hydrolase
VRGSALLSLELLSRDHPSSVNAVRPLLHTLVSADGNEAVRRLAVLSLKNGSPQRETIVLLEGIAGDDEAEAQLRKTAAGVAQQLKRRQPKR